MKFGVIPFVNMAPHYHFLSARWLQQHELTRGNPRQLGNLAKAGRLDAAPFSYADGLELVGSGEFEWLDSLGVCGAGPIQSILLVGQSDPKALAGQAIGVTPFTATTVRLLEIWLRQKHGIKDYRLVAPEEPAAARLVIGDEALKRHLELGKDEPQVDLSAEWMAWTGKPFVFARWAVRASQPSRAKMELALSVRSALDLAKGDLSEVARVEAERTGLPESALLAYLENIRFYLGPEELAGGAEFERRWNELLAG
jgi:predicted solute-binding protein